MAVLMALQDTAMSMIPTEWYHIGERMKRPPNAYVV